MESGFKYELPYIIADCIIMSPGKGIIVVTLFHKQQHLNPV